MGKKVRRRKNGWFSGLSRKAKSAAGTGVELAGVSIILEPVVVPPLQAFQQKLAPADAYSFVTTRYRQQYTEDFSGLVKAIVGGVVFLVGRAIKRM